MKRRIAIVVALALVCGSCSVAKVQSQPPLAAAAEPAAREPFPVPVITLRGSAAEIGTHHGEQLGATIRPLFDGYLGKYFKNDTDKTMALFAAGMFAPHMAAEHRDEIAALAKGAALDSRIAMLAQCFLDLSEMTACSAVALPASASPDGVARLGRNLDFPSFNIADKHTVLLVYRPSDNRYGLAAIGWPGLVGVLSGMNEHGLTLSNMEVDRPRRAPSAMPYTLLYRTVLERCRTVDEAVALLQRTPRQSANNLILMDAAGDRAVVELTPDSVHVRRPTSPDNALISTNHQRGDDADTLGFCRRYDLLRAVSKEKHGAIDEPAIESMLEDVSQGRMSLQSMVFEPSARVIHLAVGKNAPSNTFHRIDLNEYFTPKRVVAAE